MFEIGLPNGFTQVKQLCFHKEYRQGFSYKIEMLSILQDSERTFYLRQYTNACTSEANGRPSTTIRDVCYRIEGKTQLSQINENNWEKHIPLEERLHPTVVIEDTNECCVDQQTLDFVKKNV